MDKLSCVPNPILQHREILVTGQVLWVDASERRWIAGCQRHRTPAYRLVENGCKGECPAAGHEVRCKRLEAWLEDRPEKVLQVWRLLIGPRLGPHEKPGL